MGAVDVYRKNRKCLNLRSIRAKFNSKTSFTNNSLDSALVFGVAGRWRDGTTASLRDVMAA